MTILDIIVVPKSSRSIITLSEEGDIKVYLNSPPADGKANKECIQLFSKKLKVAKSHISIIKGDKGRKKRLEIEGISQQDIINKLI
jgi:uncharacterized protein (TIGR00251 family)